MNSMQRLQVTTLLPVFALAGLAVVAFLNQLALTGAQNNRYASQMLAQELRVSSDELTRLARTYVVTADPQYETEYWRILDVRNGVKPRADGRTIALRKLMEMQGFTEAEFRKLKEAEDNSNALVRTETIAMNAIKGRFDDGRGGFTRTADPDAEMARRIMHDPKYHADKAIIMGPIAQFEQMLDERTAAVAAVAESRSERVMMLVLGFAILSPLFIWINIGRHARILRRSISDLSAATETVAGGACQVSSASRSLAEGASHQVNAVEEISSSAQSTSRMAAQAASTLKSASSLVAKEQEGFSGAKDRLAQMVSAMEEIDAASGRISKINKVIDEIAFQTNILALNAAVEAARAGEAGLGFAVVADEVRSLAQRCSQAARETALLIDESIARTQAGRQRVDEVSAAIQLLVQGSTHIHRLVDEVHRGSEEQSRAVERIESALRQIEHSAQSTASGAEEGSVAAEELTTQSHVLQQVVASLEALVASQTQIEAGSNRALVRRQPDAV